MRSNLKLEMIFNDRLGIVADVSALLAQNGLNIVSMEVARKDKRANLYLEAEIGDHSPGREEIFQSLGAIPDLLDINDIKTLPQENREKRFQAVLDNVSDGIIAVDREGKITTINRVAEEILDCASREVVGKKIEEIDIPDQAILACLDRKPFINRKKDIITKKGRFQFFATGKPIKNAAGSVIGAVEIMKDMKEIRDLAQAVSQPLRMTLNDFLGRSPAIKEAISYAKKIARTDSIVSIRGDSGTGKELFARGIHFESGRTGPFVAVNCAALPEPLLESELFGYEGGAFTGAKKQGKPGLFELANDGTIFLDEIADMPPGPQAKILRVIQDRIVRRIGGTKEIPVNPRIIAATNKNLEQMVREGLFREDLYYRINVLPIHIPPLKERIEDIPVLVEHFIMQLNARLNKAIQSISEGAFEKLNRHLWPGNVRELKNVIERAAILCDVQQISDAYILFSNEIGSTMQGMSGELREVLEQRPLKAMVNRYEKRIISETLGRSKSIRQAAQKLGVSHTTLLNKLKKFGTEMEW